MTLTRFVTKSAFRNKRRSILTVLSIAFSLILLTVMMTVWHRWYLDKGDAQVVANDNAPPEEKDAGSFVERLTERRSSRVRDLEGVA